MCKKFFITFLLSFSLLAAEDFPVSPLMKVRVDFWKKVFSQIDSSSGILHDLDDLSIIYGVVNGLDKIDSKKNEKIIELEKEKIKEILLQIIAKNGLGLTLQEELIYSKVSHIPLDQLLVKSERIRLQQGLKDRYYNGLLESYKFIDFIKKEAKKSRVPERVAYLPHVESSFNYNAYSKVGAAGIWQFMPSTARMYKMKINSLIDQRRDPVVSTKAAMRLLKYNYQKIKSWPLALTAYNHGLRSMENAVAQVGSTDMDKIIKYFDGRNFGFASKNFYASFMAASDIAMNPEIYFGTLPQVHIYSFKEYVLKRNTKVKDLIKEFNVPLDVLAEYNKAVRKNTWNNSEKILPKGLLIHLPIKGSDVKNLKGEVSSQNVLENALKKLAQKEVEIKKEFPLSPEISNYYDLSVKRKSAEYGVIILSVDESIWQVSDWSGISLSEILKDNIKEIGPGTELILRLDKNKELEFTKKRETFHKLKEEEFFEHFMVVGLKESFAKSGETFSLIAKNAKIPLWLLLKYQKAVNNYQLKVGQTVIIPQVVASCMDSIESN